MLSIFRRTHRGDRQATRSRASSGPRLSLTQLEARENPASMYDITWLGAAAAGDNYSTAQAISDTGQVVGTSGVQHPGTTNGMVDAVGPYQAFSWTAGGGMVGLGTLNGSESYASAVNNNGVIAGTYNYYVVPYQVNGGGYYEWAWYGQAGQIQTIPGHDQIGGHSRAQGINDAGVVVGVSIPTDNAYKFDGTTFTTLGNLGGQFSQAVDINNAGWVAGFADAVGSYYHATIWSPSGAITDIGTLGLDSYATKLNESGMVVGYSATMDPALGYTLYHPFLYNGTSMIDIGTGLTGNGFANSINNAGQVVGGSGNPSTNKAWLYENGSMYDLSALVTGGLGADTFSGANDINNRGQIVGEGVHNGHVEAYLLTPATTLAPTITVNGGTYTYDGTTHAANATATGTGGAAVSGTFTFTYNGSATPPTATGNYAVTAAFTSADANYTNATGSGTISITRATPAVTVTGGTFAADGNAHPATATAKGIGGATVNGTFTFTYNGSATPPTAAGTYAVVATFTSTDPNYGNATGTGSLVIAPTDVVVGGNVNITRMTGNQHGSSISVDPTNPNRLFAASVLEAAGIFVSTSGDGGRTWNNRVISYPSGANAVQTAWDGYGNLFLNYLTYSRTSPASYLAVLVSTDGGATFTVLPPVSGTFASRPSLAVGPNSVWLSYTDAHSNSVIATGATVTGLGQIGAFASYAVPGSWGGTASSVAVGAAGQVLVTCQIGDSSGVGPDAIVANLNPTGVGGTFGGPVTVTATQVGGWDTSVPAQSSGIDAAVGLAWDRSGGAHTGRVYAVYTDAPSAASSATDIYTRYSDDSGATWSAAVRVTDDAAHGSKFLPSIAVDPTTGAVGVSWYDTRMDLGNRATGDTDGVANDDAQVWAAFSRDGGNTYLANVQVSTGTSNAAASEPAAATWLPKGYGDVNRSDFFGGHYFRVWADNSNSTADNPAGALHAMDVYTANVTLIATAIRATGVNVTATAGAPFAGAVATFTNLDPARPASSYSAVITWGDGTTSVGVISGSGTTLIVTGTHTYADPGSDTIHVTIRDALGVATSATTTGTAAVAALGQNAGKTKDAKFWNTASGQALITRFNGGSTHTELATWLVTNFANLYGAGAGANELTGKTNADMAALFQRFWATGGDGANAQILATALNVYATTSSLGGAQGAGAGFTVSAAGHGARSFNVGTRGAAVGVANGTKLNVFQLLQAVNARAVNGVLYNGNSTLLGSAKDLFDALNTI